MQVTFYFEGHPPNKEIPQRFAEIFAEKLGLRQVWQKCAFLEFALLQSSQSFRVAPIQGQYSGSAQFRAEIWEER